MYACIRETDADFSRECAPCNATAHSRDPPPRSLERRFVLPCSNFSGQVFARNIITVAAEVVGITRVLFQNPLCLVRV
jgi:hypothetical protein